MLVRVESLQLIFDTFNMGPCLVYRIQGVSRLTVIYNLKNTQIWVITQEIFFTFHNHRKINFHLEVNEGNLNHMLCPKMPYFRIGLFQLLGYQISAEF